MASKPELNVDHSVKFKPVTNPPQPSRFLPLKSVDDSYSVVEQYSNKRGVLLSLIYLRWKLKESCHFCTLP